MTDPVGAGAVSLRGVTKCYGPLRALDRLDLDIPAGATVAMLGPNGASKSTTIEILLGLRHPDEGATNLAGMTPARAVTAGRVGAMLQDGQLMAGVKVAALVDAVRSAYPNPAAAADLAAAAGIADLLDRRSDQLSIGQAQRVRFALAAAGNPDILVLDEPTVAMDVEAREAFWAALRAGAAGGRTIVFSTHYLEEADAFAERIVVLRAGKVVADGTPGDVRAAAGIRRQVTFRCAEARSEAFRQLPGVTHVTVDHDHVVLTTTEADTTLWALYDHRHAISDIDITGGDLQHAFLALTKAD
ncbi:MAG: ABC transporter ATP-binding protein [Actinomycetota bacterium]|nr:ABC transporter ATP-binding protein [Actinomycetota bacterium]